MISATGSATTVPAATTSLGVQEFLRVLSAQLMYQDPLKPMDNQAFMGQIAQFTALQQTNQLNSNIEQLIVNQASLQSIGLIGRTVDVTTSTGSVTGTVAAVSFASSTPSLTVKTAAGAVLSSVDLGQVTAVR